MPRNASGIYTLPAGNPVVPGDVIDAAWANSTLSDIATELTNSLSRTGAGGMIAPFRVADGSVSAPGLAFLNETNTGIYRASAGTYALAVLGVNTATFSTVGLTIPSTKALTAQGNASVGGTFGVTGATTLSSTLAVTGAITATGGVVGNVTGNVTAAAGSSSFNDVVITGALDMTAGSSATITGLSTPTNASDAANKGYVDTQDALRLALTGGTLTGALAMSTNKITGLGTPTADTDAANKSYVDSVAQGLDAKASCRAATTGNISLSGTQTIDGVAVIAGDRVLVKDQSSAAENGIYVAAAGAWSRASDANTWDELVSAFTFVEQGTTNGNNGYICTISAGGTLGVTAVTWAQFSGAGQINAGTGMSKTGNTLNVNTASSARIVVGADEIDLATSGVVAGTYKSVTVDQWGRATGGTNPTTLAGYGITDAYTTAQTDTLLNGKLSLSGGTMTGAIAMGTNKITGMGDPTNAQDAATKNYIDTIFGSTASAAASASAAATSASNAASSASAAASSASAASGSASSASASAISASSSAASAATSLDQFEDQYLGAKASNPTVDNDGNPLITGALYFNTTANEMRVYTGSGWIATGSAVNGTSKRQTFTATASQTTFTITGGYDAGYADVYLNGAKLVNGTDVTVSSGTDVVLATGAAAGDIVDVVAYGAFSLANMVSKTGDTMTGALLLPAGSASAPSLAASGDANTGVFFPAADTVAIATGGTERARVDSSGNVGIGTSSPSNLLHVSQASSDFQVRVTGTSAANLGAIRAYNVGGEASVFGTTGASNSGYGANLGVLGTVTNIPQVFVTNNTERARIDTSGNFQFNSGYGSVATAYGCRAWVNFNGTGTVAIRASGNVSSITDNNTGDYTVNFTTVLPDANYSTVAGTNNYQVFANFDGSAGTTTTKRVLCRQTNSPATAVDCSEVDVAVFR